MQFTAAHSNLGAVGVTLEGPGGPYAFTLNPDAGSDPAENLFGTADPDGWTFASLPPCAYLLKLSVGRAADDRRQRARAPLVDYIAFCKGRSRDSATREPAGGRARVRGGGPPVRSTGTVTAVQHDRVQRVVELGRVR